MKTITMNIPTVIRISRQQLPSKKAERYYKDLKLCKLESKVSVVAERLSLRRELTRVSSLVQ